MHHLLLTISPQITPLPKQILLSSHNCNNNNYYYYTTNKLYVSYFWPTIRRKHVHKWRVLASEREPGFEVDQEKARQALSDLDQQLESLSNKQINPPKFRASSLSNLKEQMKEEPPEITGSVLGSFAFVLFLFSIFYNILFATVIKPYVDGPDDVVVSNVTTNSREASIVRQP